MLRTRLDNFGTDVTAEAKQSAILHDRRHAQLNFAYHIEMVFGELLTF